MFDSNLLFPITEEDLAKAVDKEAKAVASLSPNLQKSYVDSKARDAFLSFLALRAVRNSLAPISRIPDEILVSIFWLVVQEGRASYQFSKGISWLSVTKVCRRWRATALHAAKLWSVIDTRKVNVAAEFLTRSGMAPLDVYIAESFKNNSTEVLQLLAPHFGRIQKLLLRSHVRALQGLQDLLQKPLNSLEILCAEITFGPLTPIQATRLILPSLFGGSSPPLRQVYLESLTMPWTPVVFPPSLVHLSLSHQHPEQAPTMDEFRTILKGCGPRLETLSFSWAGPSLPEGIHSIPADLIELPRLREISLAARPYDMSNILAQLKLPVSCNITLSYNLDIFLSDIEDVLPTDCSSLLPIRRVHRLDVLMPESSSMTLLGWDDKSTRALDLTVNLTTEMTMDPNKCLEVVFSRLRPPNTEQLQVSDCEPYIRSSTWLQIFEAIPAITKLTVVDDSGVLIGRELLSSLSSAVAGGACQHLKELRLQGLFEDPEIIPAFANMCISRDAIGIPLEKLGIRNVSQTMAESIRLIYPNFQEDWEDEDA